MRDPDYMQEIDAHIQACRELMVAKDADYGDAWRKLGMPAIAGLINAKITRVRHLIALPGGPSVSEGVEAELRDIVNYCLFGLLIASEDADAGH